VRPPYQLDRQVAGRWREMQFASHGSRGSVPILDGRSERPALLLVPASRSTDPALPPFAPCRLSGVS
jgi:hypothetical protein